jgi:hypothetical protein
MDPERRREIEELYHAASDDPAALNRADPVLRQEVESLLAERSSLLELTIDFYPDRCRHAAGSV